MKQLIAIALLASWIFCLGITPARATTSSLTVRFELRDLRALQASGANVVVVDPMSRFDEKPLTWVAFPPEREKTLTWIEQYSIYASSQQPVPGEYIASVDRITEASPGRVYAFNGDTYRESLGSELAANQYGVLNLSPQQRTWTFGLARIATGLGSNRERPLNAASILYNQQAIFTPSEKIWVFIATSVSSGEILNRIPDNALEVDLTENTSQAVIYDRSTGEFRLASPASTDWKESAIEL